MLKFGIVTQVDPAKARVRVKFEEDDVVSDWLPVIQQGALKNKAYTLPDTNEQVACLMDAHAENGVCVGSTYNQTDEPGFTSADKYGVKFESGDEIVYDRATRKYRVKTNNGLFELSNSGPTLKKGSESLKQIMLDLIDQILAETHPTTGAGPSGTPINSPAYIAIKTRVNNFFEA
jgi:phage baseplate assembly protein V